MSLEVTKAEPQPLPSGSNKISRVVLDSAFAVHSTLGPGLLESLYETCLAYELSKRGAPFQRQVSLPVQYADFQIDAALRIDIWANRSVIIEVKAVETLLPVHQAQVLTYLKLTGNRLGLLINSTSPYSRTE